MTTDFTQLVDLAARRLGGAVLACNDEFFAPKENLLLDSAPVFEPGRYTHRGKWMDGWETRRRREPGDDWALVRLGAPGLVRGVVVDTAHFTGNYPEACAVEAAALEGNPTPDDLDDPAVEWATLVERTPLAGDTAHRFAVDSPYRWTHVRLRIYPDGGVARLRVHGEPLADLRAVAGPQGWMDLAAATAGARALDASDRFFSSPHNLLLPGPPRDMGDGWETRRRRGPGHDWVLIALAAPGRVDRVEVDTTHFKGNAPGRCSVEVAAPGDADSDPDGWGWVELLPATPLRPDTLHRFDVAAEQPASHLRLRIFPDGGVARLRVHGRVDRADLSAAALRWLNALPPARAVAELRACCGSWRWARTMAARRPYPDAAALADAADEVWGALDTRDWLEAFAAHPRIGERSQGWARGEQAGTAGAAGGTLAALAEGNRAYEERFGHVFLVCATGKSAEEMLAALRDRLDNPPDTELAVAAEEQRRITRLRLAKLLQP